MSNRKQRMKNRYTAASISTCQNCGERGAHWIMMPMLMFPIQGPREGFWTCPKYYDPITKRRIVS